MTKMGNHSIQLYTSTDILKRESGQTVTGTTNPNVQNIFLNKNMMLISLTLVLTARHRIILFNLGMRPSLIRDAVSKLESELS